jgi:hypothetical protein
MVACCEFEKASVEGQFFGMYVSLVMLMSITPR